MARVDQFTLLQRAEQSTFEIEISSDEIMLVHQETEKYHQLNQTACQLWRWLKEPQTANTLAEKISQNYLCHPETCQLDILTWLQDSYEKKLLCIVSESAIKNNYHPPKNSLLDPRAIQGSQNSFATDNFETGS